MDADLVLLFLLHSSFGAFNLYSHRHQQQPRSRMDNSTKYLIAGLVVLLCVTVAAVGLAVYLYCLNRSNEEKLKMERTSRSRGMDSVEDMVPLSVQSREVTVRSTREATNPSTNSDDETDVTNKNYNNNRSRSPSADSWNSIESADSPQKNLLLQRQQTQVNRRNPWGSLSEGATGKAWDSVSQGSMSLPSALPPDS